MAYTLAAIRQAPSARISASVADWTDPHTLRRLSKRERKELARQLSKDPDASTVVLSVSARSARKMQGAHAR